MIEHIRTSTGHGVRRICEVLEVPRSSYYHAAVPTPSERSDRDIGDQIEAVFKRHRRRYGIEGFGANWPSGVSPAPRPASAGSWRNAASRLSSPRPTCPEPATRRIVGWSLAGHMRAGLVADALKQALQTRRPGAGLGFHSDRGSQYGSAEYRALLARTGAVQSMSARANPYHNAWTESFMGTLKGEMLQGGCFIDESDARTELFDYIEAYYNTHRKHSSLGYRTPVQFEAVLNSLN